MLTATRRAFVSNEKENDKSSKVTETHLVGNVSIGRNDCGLSSQNHESEFQIE